MYFGNWSGAWPTPYSCSTFCIHREVKGLLVGIRARHLMADRLTISSPISLRTWQATPDTWVHSASDGRTLIWDRHDLIYGEGEPLEDMAAVLRTTGFESGAVPRADVGPHIHYYRPEFDADAAAMLSRFGWFRSDLRPEDEQ
jgi:hypothetical protein